MLLTSYEHSTVHLFPGRLASFQSTLFSIVSVGMSGLWKLDFISGYVHSFYLQFYLKLIIVADLVFTGLY